MGALLLFVREELQGLLESIGITADGGDGEPVSCISRATFEDLLTKPNAIKVIHQVGVDVIGLVDQTDFIFENDQELTFAEFFDLILKLRGSNTATVKDMVDLRKLLRTEMDHMQECFESFKTGTMEEAVKTKSMRVRSERKPAQMKDKQIKHNPL